MNKIICISENSFFILDNGKKCELPAGCIVRYREALKSIQRRNEWKTSGKGAQFTGVAQEHVDYDVYNINAAITGADAYGDGFIYSASVDGVGGMYLKSTDKEDTSEGHVLTNNNFSVNSISVQGDKCAASLGYPGQECHLALFELPSGTFRELTEGDTREEHPYMSRRENRILFSAAGFARSQQGDIVAVSPHTICAYDLSDDTMDELFASENYNCVYPKDDENGNIYYIRRPYKDKPSNKNILKDIFLFPVRIVKAIGGFLNIFSVMFGGEPLRSDGTKRGEKAKQKSQADLFIDGNRINAEQILKENENSGDKFPGIIPKSWELVKNSDGEETIVKKGVLDYTICTDGSIIYSNGRALVRINNDGSEELIEKIKLATNIIEIYQA